METMIEHIYHLTKHDNITRPMLIEALYDHYGKPEATLKTYITSLIVSGVLLNVSFVIKVNPIIINGLKKSKGK